MSARIVMLGMPGAGKGTQSVLLAERLGVPTISTGNIFRHNVAEKTALGQKVESFLSSGQLVPDELTDELVRDRLAQPDAADGFVLDGYPRNVHQASALETMLPEGVTNIDIVVELEVDEDVVVQRMLDRAVIEGRSDDTEDVIRARIDVYHEETKPLTVFYEDRGLLCQVDGVGEVSEVTQRMLDQIREHSGHREW
jgi:adenylate kinase